MLTQPLVVRLYLIPGLARTWFVPLGRLNENDLPRHYKIFTAKPILPMVTVQFNRCPPMLL